MSTKIVCVVLAIGIGFVITFGVRQRTLNDLRAGNKALRQQVEAPAPAHALSSRAEPQTSNSIPALSQEEHLELLTLRGQIGALRRELDDASNRVANASQTNSPRAAAMASEITAEQQARIQQFQTSQQGPVAQEANRFALALGKYLAQNAGQLPDDLAKAEPFGADLPQGVSRRFELVRSGAIPEDERAYTLVAHEKEPQQTPDGRWRRVCFFAAGTTVTLTSGQVSSQTPDWLAMERRAEDRAKQRALQPPNAGSR